MKGIECVQDEVLDLTVVVPTYNPDKKLSEKINSLLKRGFHDIIVVNDGSDEKYMKFFDEVEDNSTVIHCRKNKGRAMKVAFSFCSKYRKKSNGVIVVDFAYSYHPDDVYACGKALFENRGHLILGCRDFRDGKISLVRRVENNIKKKVYSILGGIKVSDTGAGVCAIGMSLVHEIVEIKGEYQDYECNILLETKKMSLPITEVTIRMLSA